MKTDEKTTWILSEKEIASLRSSPKQLVCVRMLLEGDHRSFAELVLLLRQDRRLEQRPDKLELLREHLSRAERAERTGSWAAASEQRLILGRLLSTPEDMWLGVHFYRSCTERQQAGRAATEARARLSELHLHMGELAQARQQGELCVQQERAGGGLDSDGLDSDGRPLRLCAARALWGAYARLAAALLDAGDGGAALALLHEGHRACAEAGDKRMEAEAGLRLGLAYQRAGKHDAAKQFFHACMQIYGTLQDPEGLVEAYRATASSLHSEGNIEETIQCLEKLVDISRSNNLQQKMADTWLHLGRIYFTRAQYQTAAQYFLQSYTVGDVSLRDKAQAMLAAARAHALMGRYTADVASGSPDAVSRLLSWKEGRGQRDFSGDAADRY